MEKKVTITSCESDEMLWIEYNGKTIFSGNVWDFDRSAEGFKYLFQALGIEVEVVEKESDYPSI